MPLPRYQLFALFYLAWIIAHFAAAHIYARYCTPYTVWGFIMSPLIASSPHCAGLRWVISTGGSNITAMWALAGVWIATKISAM